MVKVDFFQGLSLACLVGLLLFLKWDSFHGSSSLLVVSSCHIFGEGGFFQGLPLAYLVGLLACLEVGFFHWASSLLVVSSCHVFFVKVGFVQGLSLACLAGLLLLLKWDVFDWASSLRVVCGCQVFLCSCFCSGPVTGPAWSACCFSWSGISSVELPICLLPLAAFFFVKVFFFRACHWPAWSGCCFSLSGFFHWASSLLVVSSCHFFVKVFLFQGLSPACLVGLLLFVKWDFSTRLLAFFSLRSRAFSGQSF